MNTYWRSMSFQVFNLSAVLTLCMVCTAWGQPVRTPHTDDWSTKFAQIGVLINNGELKEACKQADGLVNEFIGSADNSPLLIRYAIPLEAILTKLDHEPGLDRLAGYIAERFEAIPLDNLKGESLVGMAGLMKRAGRNDHLQTIAEQGRVLIRHAETNQRVLSLPQLDSLGRLAQLSGSEELRDLVDHQRESINPSDPATRLALAPLEFVYLSDQYQKSGDTDALDDLARFIVKDYLPHPGVSASIFPSEWLDLGRIVASSRDKDARVGMADLLMDAVHRGQVPISRQRSDGLRALVADVEELRGSQDDAFRDLITSRWLGLLAGWDELTTETRQSLTAIVLGDRQVWTPLTNSLAELHEQGDLEQAGYIALIFTSARLGLREEAQGWGRRMVESKWFTPTAYGLRPGRIGATLMAVAQSGVSLSESQSQQMIELIQSIDLISPQLPDQAYAAAAAMLLRSDSVHGLESVQSLESGELNLAVIKTLSWAYADQGDALSFARELNTSVDTEAGDTLAVRLLAITYAVSIHYGDSPRTAGMTEYLRNALESAETDSTRMRVLEELTAMALVNGNTDYALGIIEEVRPQFAEADQARLSEWSNRLQRLKEAKSRRVAMRQEARAFAPSFSRKRRAY